MPVWSRRTLLGLLAVAVIFGATLEGDGGAAGELRRRLGADGAPGPFAFEHRPGGTQVLGCVLRNRLVSGVVDTERRTAVLETEGTVVVHRRGDRVFLSPALFDPGLLQGAWLAVRLPSQDRSDAAVRAALGTVLSRYALAEGLPADGRDTALAALDAAVEVRRLDAASVEGRPVDRYRILIDAAAFSEGVDGDAANSDVPPPEIDVLVDEGDEVLRVVVTPTGTGEGPGVPEAGWTVDYRPAPPVDRADPLTIIDVEDLRRPILPAPGDRGCDLEL